MEIPSRVSVFSTLLDIKGKPGTLIAINALGFFEVALEVKERNHTVLFPISSTVLIFNDPLPQATAEFEVER